MRKRSVALVLVTVGLTSACGSPAGEDESPVPAEVDGRIEVPEGDGGPVLLDGVFTPGEWDDAFSVTADEMVTLRLKQVGDHVFIGTDVDMRYAPVIDLYLQAGDGPIMQFHASAQLGERALAPAGEEDPDFRWGMTHDWYANEVRWDQIARDSLAAAGADEATSFGNSVLPYDGFEMQFRRVKLPGSEWHMRVEISAAPDYETPHVYPPDTERKDTEGWAVLALSEPGSG